MAIDHAILAQHTLLDLSTDSLQAALQAQELGIVRRMQHMARLLLAQYGHDVIARLQSHLSDTVRGWACFTIAELPALSLSERLERMTPLANDEHLSVREWSWLALRPHVIQAPAQAVELLLDWSQSPSERLRRFSCEILRPRGLRCKHIAHFKENPAAALPILHALRHDHSTYVQDSVANWLCDAAKTQPEWVRALCRNWALEIMPELAYSPRRIRSRKRGNQAH